MGQGARSAAMTREMAGTAVASREQLREEATSQEAGGAGDEDLHGAVMLPFAA